MRPFQYKMVGYAKEDPYDFYHGKWLGAIPTLVLLTEYPNEKEDWAGEGKKGKPGDNKCRHFPFIIHPNFLNELKKMGTIAHNYVVVTYYIDTMERGKTIKAMLIATRIELVKESFPYAKKNEAGLYINANTIVEDFDYGKI